MRLMPYKSVRSLPKRVRKALPKGGEAIYLRAYNNTWKQYKYPSTRRKGFSREETAHAVAWTAVKTKYKKNKEGRWVQK